MDLWPDRIGGPGAFFVNVHGHDAAAVHRVVRDLHAGRHAAIVVGYIKCGEVVRYQCDGFFGQTVDQVVGVGGRAPQVEDVADSGTCQVGLELRDTFEDEGMEAVVGVGVRAGQAFVDE